MSKRKEPRERKWLTGSWELATVLVALGVVSAVAWFLGSSGTGEVDAVRIATAVQRTVRDRPREAALAALGGYRLDPSSSAELNMLDVALANLGIERVVHTGTRQVTAALVLERELITASASGLVQVWRRSDGALVGQTKLRSPLTALAGTDPETPIVVAADRRGRLELFDLTEPRHLRVWPLASGLSPGEPLLALSFSGQGVDYFHPGDVTAVGAAGEVRRIDATTGRLVSRRFLSSFRGPLPWNRGGELRLSAAKFIPEATEDEEGLLVATTDGAVAELDLGRGQGKTRLSAGTVPGRALALDRVPYGGPEWAVGATGGLVVPDEEGNAYVEHGPPVSGVSLSYEEGLRHAGSEGVSVPAAFGYIRPPEFGPPVQRLSVGGAGVAAISPGGDASVLGRTATGLSPAELEPTPVVAFAPNGRLVVARGYDANHIEKLATVDPRPLGEDEYEEDREIRTFRPDPSWAGEAEDREAFYLNDVADDGRYLAAGGQDPTGTAAVFVWDARTGRPLRRLPLGTGGIATEEPSIVTKLLLLPERHEIAAYSAVQQLVAVWSTDTWHLEAAIPVGPIGDLSLSPDESTIAAVDLGQDEENYVEPGERTDLIFIDVADGKVDHEVAATAAEALAWSPDGSVLAVADKAGALRFLSPHGRQEARPKLHLPVPADALAWRPDGSMLAADLPERGVALVDPKDARVSVPLPVEDAALVSGLEWSPDGSRLVAPISLPDEHGEGYEPGPVTVWALSAADLERRMCQLTGGPATRSQWDRDIGSGSMRPLCRSPRERGPVEPAVDDASSLRSLDLLFRRGDFLLAGDPAGKVARLGRLDPYSNPMPGFDWSYHGLAWSSPGQVNALEEGAARARSHPCFCSGVFWDGDKVVSIESTGRALVSIFPDGRLRTTPVDGALGYGPTLLGAVGREAIVAAFEEEPTRATPSTLFAVDPHGAVEKLGVAPGAVYRLFPSSSDRVLAFVAGVSAGVCYSTSRVGILSETKGGLSVRYPPSPSGKAPVSVRSVQVASDGSISAAFAPIGCRKGTAPDSEPLARRYRLAGERWRPTDETGWDVQTTSTGTVIVGPPSEAGLFGRLSLRSAGAPEVVVHEAGDVVARP